MVQWRDSKVSRDGVELAVRTWSEDKSPTVMLVHGYPDASHVWEKVAERLSRDFRVVAYDVRGSGNSSAPDGKAAYRLSELSADLYAVLEAVSPDQPVHLVGHDWGSIQGWEAITEAGAEQRIASYTSLSGPCLDHVGHWMQQQAGSHPTSVLNQLGHSWYIGAFHLPGAPLAWKAGLARLWPRLLQTTEQLHTDPSGTQLKDGTHGINLYRANMLPRLLKPRQRSTRVPVQQLQADHDNFVRPAMLDSALPWTDRLWRRSLATGHWGPLLQYPDVTSRYIREFIKHIDGAPASGALQRARLTAGADSARPDCGKLVVITGAGSGIGRETALAYGRRGAQVLCTDIDADAAQASADIITREGGLALSRKADVSSSRSMEALARFVDKELGAPDIVVNNAGIGLAGSLLDTSVKDWQQVLGVNLWGVIHGCRLFARQMIDQGKAGHIVNTASAAAFMPSRVLPAYATSKSAVLMLSECLRAELAEHGIGVSAICPGVIDTPITRRTRFVGVDDEEQARRQEKTQKLYQRRAYTPDRVAQAIVQAVLDNQAVVAVSPEAAGMQWLGRLTPALARNLARVDMTP
ncbi:MAG: SDR family oxidoreductase [Alcanivorax sp.]|nr:SDR family oxidoreductase [Alcanivorax sp.]